MASINKCFLFFFVGLCMKQHRVLAYETNYCYSQACRECPISKQNGPGEQVKCDLSALVSTDWLGTSRPQLPFNIGNLADYACIKMVATDTTATYDSTDVVRGCVIAQTAQSVCDGLVGMELARGKSDARCSYCTRDYCNGSTGITASIILLLSSFIIAKIFNY